MVETANKILIRIESDISKLRKGMKDGTKEIESFGKKSNKTLKSFKTIAETALGFSFANLLQFATENIVNFTKQAVTSGLQYERAFKSLEFQTKNTANSLIKNLSMASQSMVSSLDLIQTANKALALGISQNQLPELMEVATARAKIMGISVTQAFEDISIGIGRQSKLILDNLGIVLDLEKSYLSYAESIGKTVEQLSDFEKKQAITNSIIEESKGLVLANKFAMLDNADAIEQLKAGFQDFTRIVGEQLVSKLTVARNSIKAFQEQAGDKVLTDEAIEGLTNVGRALQDVNKEILSSQESLRSLKLELEGIGKTKITGQAAFDVEQQEKINLLDRLRLDLLREQNRNKDAGLESSVREVNLSEMIEARERELVELRLQRKIQADNELILLQKQGKLQTENLLKEEKSLKNVKTSIENIVSGITLAKDNIKINKDIVEIYNEQAVALSKNTRELKQQEVTSKRIAVFATLAETGIFGIELQSISKRLTQINRITGIGAESIETANRQNPILVQIENVFGTDPTDVANALQDTLSTQIR